MATSKAERQALLARTLPQRREVQRMVSDYLSRTGLTYGDFAKRIGYAEQSMRMFMCNAYHGVAGDDSAIRAAAHDHIITYPIQVYTDIHGKLYETKNVALIRDCFNKALNHGQAYYFHGAPGSQKTHVLQHLIASLNLEEVSKNGHGKRAFYVYCSEGVSPARLMRDVAEAAGSISVPDARRIFKNLRYDLRGRKSLFVFDEAQHLSVSCLETLRELHDMPPNCGLLFAGSHQLKSTFQRLDMEQWHSRLTQGEDLPGIQEDEARDIIAQELGELSKSKIEQLVKQARAADQRKGREVTYISARRLFNSIRGIKSDPRFKAKGATA
ncbi:MAG TPA: ATP-binding protein [Candidatus Angelobacter sp.]|nr:ATP-binding protein [Candidatus Angelobacter sp.]